MRTNLAFLCLLSVFLEDTGAFAPLVKLRRGSTTEARERGRRDTDRVVLFTGVSSASSSSAEEKTKKGQHVVIVGGGIGGLASAYDARHILPASCEITVVSASDVFSFTPSNPWVAVHTREPRDIQRPLAKILPRHRIEFVHGTVKRLDPNRRTVQLENGDRVSYDYLIIATGPRLGFEEVPGLKEHGVSVCTTPHAVHAAEALDRLKENPGPVVVGATQGASCFGPAYEYALLLQNALKKHDRKLVKQCPITFVTSEPWPGHMGLNGVGKSREILEKLLKDNHIAVWESSRVKRVDKDKVLVEKLNEQGKVVEKASLPSHLTMLIPPFHGHSVWAQVPGLTDKHGMVQINEFQQSVKYPEIFGVGTCVHLDSPFAGPVPVGIPKTGYMIESMGTAAVKNIRDLMMRQDNEDKVLRAASTGVMHETPLLNGLCITDFGEEGAIFVAMPQVPPRRYDWTISGKIATLAKIAFEKYFLHKIETGDTDPYYEKYMLQLIGVERTKHEL